jgi:hypothetical protein
MSTFLLTTTLLLFVVTIGHATDSVDFYDLTQWCKRKAGMQHDAPQTGAEETAFRNCLTPFVKAYEKEQNRKFKCFEEVGVFDRFSFMLDKAHYIAFHGCMARQRSLEEE